jgi:hypothetical protein
MAEAMMGGSAPQPTMEDFAAFEQIRQEVSPSEINETLLATAAEADPMAVAEFKSELRDLDLPPEVLDALDGMVDEILAAPERYAEIRAQYLAQDMSEELLPEVFDAEFFGALNMALDEIRATSGGPARAPQGFARGGIASLGRNGDTMLAHVTPAEMRMLKANGGAGTINPRTGLPEFFSLKKAFSKIGRAVKKFARSTIGKIVIGTALFMFVGPMAYGALGLTAGTASAAAVSGFVAGAGSSLLAGESLKDSLKAGAIGGIIAGAVQGVSNTFGGPSLTGQDKLASGADISTLAGPPAELGASVTGPVGGDPFNVADMAATLKTPTAPLATPTAPLATPTVSLTPEALSTAASRQAAIDATSQGYLPAANAGVASLPVESPFRFYEAGTGTGAAGTQSLASSNVPIIESAGVQGPNVTDPIGVPMKTVEPKSLYQRGLDKLMPSRIEAAGNIKADALADAAYDKALAGGRSDAYAISRADAVRTAAQPGMIQRFGPLTAAGMGVMGLAGGFNTEEPQIPDGYGGFMDAPGQRLLDQYPERYGLSFGGVRPMGSSGYQTYTPPPYKAAQGSGPSGVAQGFPRMNGPIDGPGTGTSDDVPAMLSDGEFVFTAKAVRNMGNGSRRKGAKKMYALMKKLEGTA